MRTLITLATSFLFSSLFAQSPYWPFPESDAGWVENHSWLESGGLGFVANSVTRTILFANDTTIGGTTYHQLRSRGQGMWQTTSIPIQYGFFTETDAVFVRFRQDVDARKVFVYDTITQQEVLWYDFTLGLGDYPQTYDQQFTDGTVQVVALDSMELNDGWHRTWVLGTQVNGVPQDSAYCTVIEGVGTTFGLRTVYGLMPPFEWGDNLNCHSVGGFTVHPFGETMCDLAMGTTVPSAPITRAIICSPNPATSSLTIGGSLPAGARYVIFDGRGVEVQQGVLRSSMIDVGALAPAPYVVRLSAADGLPLGTVRVMKE